MMLKLRKLDCQVAKRLNQLNVPKEFFDARRAAAFLYERHVLFVKDLPSSPNCLNRMILLFDIKHPAAHPV